jgi:hypothetical protein
VTKYLEERISWIEGTHGFDSNVVLQNRKLMYNLIQVFVQHHGVISGPDSEAAIQHVQQILKVTFYNGIFFIVNFSPQIRKIDKHLIWK